MEKATFFFIKQDFETFKSMVAKTSNTSEPGMNFYVRILLNGIFYTFSMTLSDRFHILNVCTYVNTLKQ